MNGTGDALRFGLYGLPTCSEIKFTGNASFTGTIYAPQATLKDSGGGNDVYDTVGAVIVGAVTMNGHTQFHYDENLGRNGPRSTYLVSTWNEY
jgi:choice-of-anchor A domain-containing protein